MTETDNNVVKFPYSASRRVHSRRPRKSKNGTPEERAAPPPAMEVAENYELPLIAGNERLRAKRAEAWSKAEATTHYWEARRNFHLAIYVGQQRGMIEARRDHPKVEVSFEVSAMAKIDEAITAQLLTPAPTVAAVNWKRQKLKRGYLALKIERVERAIADDLAFLDAHPARQCKSNKQRGKQS